MSRVHKPRPTDSSKAVPSSLCPDCGKLRYFSKADAKKSARRQGRQRSRFYRCGDFWHMTSWGPADSIRWYRDRA